ncbi:MAG TPA: amidohydrolase family protein [Acidimicrobiia bacterium]|jgi:aminocarboxymuconate-semialdehyde decarboxylase|nr:amidohydrolase family protein [Acidimicrobiia bacterium]
MTTYDVHAHCIPPALIETLRSEGSALGIELRDEGRGEQAVIADRVRLAPFNPVLTDMDARLAAMDATGVDVQLLSGWVDLTAYALDGDAGARYSRLYNEILVDEAGEHPDRFQALGTVPLQHPEHAAEELAHAVSSLGMAGVQIATTVAGTDLDQAGLDPFWEAAEDLGCLIVLHPCDPLPGVDLSRNFLDNMVGRPAESTIAVAHLIFSGLLERFPGLVICVVHGGGFVPYQLGRMQRGFDAVPRMAAQNITTPPQELARRLYYDTVLHDPAPLAFLVEHVGADHVVMGTDYPFPMGDPTPVDTVKSIPGLSDDQRQSILGDNVARLLEGVVR